MTTPPIILWGSVFVGLMVGWFVWSLLSIIYRSRQSSAQIWEFEADRRIRLRQKSLVYRWFEPLIDELRNRTTTSDPDRLLKLQREIDQNPGGPPWKASEYLAGKQIESLLAAACGAVFGLVMAGSGGAVVMSLIALVGYQLLMSRQMGDLARRRTALLKSRLPFAVDLMAFMMEAGASFSEAARTVVNTSPGHPIAAELGLLLREIAMGRPRHEALEGLQYRLNDDDIRELVFAINKGEEMGTPLGSILRTQADQMRLKRSQWAEKAAAEAQVQIVFPGMIIMAACLLIVVVPFLLGVRL